MTVNGIYFQFKAMFRAMDTEVEIAGTSLTDLKGIETELEAWFDQFENICSRFRDNSELSNLNQSPKKTVIFTHPILYDVLQMAVNYMYKTDYYFNPFLGSAIKALGYNKTFTEIRDCMDVKKVSYQYELPVTESIILLPELCGVIKESDDEIDLGGIAKGWSVDRISEKVRTLGLQNGIVNAGGDLFVWGDHEQTIGISHPNPEFFDMDIIQFTLRNGGVATSNTLYRSWTVGEDRIHHILNGKNGKSSQSDIVQATVFSMSTTEADVLAKVLCLHSFEDAVPWLAKHFPHAACVVINQNGQIAISKTLNNYVSKVVM
ncbi:FAD:protein FMN transferase [Calidifontibacillus oryziterrae]|uniref:FAD:protein FMN transferase n=1 Tax=Calidifontibacillus oryziterrae TaxID=1191699 RepID=UPI0002E33966|nr:FAD:protein FMN transferase [Calidifontibacillus oryziterrae]